MASLDLNRVKQIFAEALARNGADRAAYLNLACGDDADLRGEVEAYLSASENTGGMMGSATADRTLDPGAGIHERPGSMIGRYKLLQQIGEGGFGVVFMAEQSEPVRRKVALKIIKLGMDTRQVVARFEAERQALAVMDHPNIAKVLDGGSTDTGRPYFVMELVRGVPITQYCDEHHLTPEQRLKLFVDVCHAVQHAHQKGIIHRDLKPSNVLVAEYDEKPVPKVIDFGVAKAVGQALTDKTMFTAFGQVIGTIEYMSPEHAKLNQLDIDTRSDVYSLGVILYELLTGQTPFDRNRLQSAAFDEMLRIIREEEPACPSTRLSGSQSLPSIAANRHMEPAKLTRQVHGELDWIVMKSLEKDRQRRYETASVFAADVQRYLDDEAVHACPPSATYRLRKLARKYRMALRVAAAFVLLLIATTVFSSWQAVRATRAKASALVQKQRADEQAAIATAVSDFQVNMLSTADPERLMGDKVTVLQAISAAVDELDKGELKAQPAVEAAVRSSIGDTLRALGRYDRAEPNLRKALELRRTALPAEHPDIVGGLEKLGMLLREQGKLTEAERLFREALELRRKGLPAGHWEIARSLNNVGAVVFGQGNPADAEVLFREALAINRKALSANDNQLAITLNNLSVALREQGKLREAESLLRESLDLCRTSLPANHPNTASSLQSLAQVLQASGQLAEAEVMYREALEIRRKVMPARHPDIAMSLNNLASVLRLESKFVEGELLAREALARCRDAFPPGHPNIASTAESLAGVLLAQGKLDECEPLFREALAIRRVAQPAGHPDIADSLCNLGILLTNQRKFPDAEADLLEAERILLDAPGIPAAEHDRCVELLVALFIRWNAAEPGKGYEVKAEQWRRKLPTTRPTATRHGRVRPESDQTGIAVT